MSFRHSHGLGTKAFTYTRRAMRSGITSATSDDHAALAVSNQPHVLQIVFAQELAHRLRRVFQTDLAAVVASPMPFKGGPMHGVALVSDVLGRGLHQGADVPGAAHQNAGVADGSLLNMMRYAPHLAGMALMTSSGIQSVD